MFEIFSAVTEGLSILLSSNGTILAFNHKAEMCYGWNASLIEGKNFFMLCKQYGVEAPLPDSTLIEGNIKAQREVTTSIKSAITGVESIVQWNIVQFSEPPNFNSYFLLTGIDITQYKINEANTITLSDYFSNIINIIPHFIFWKDTNSRFLGCNQKFAESVKLNSPNDIIGKTDFEMPWTDSQKSAYISDDQAIMTSGVPRVNYEEEQQQPDGMNRIMLVSKVPLRSAASNKVIGILGIYTDITERKETERQLTQAKEAAETANRARSEFIANMSHDIKTPLSGIIGIAEVLSSRLLKEEDVNFAQNIMTAGQQLLIFFDNCLEIAKSEGIDVALSKEHFNLRTLIQEISDLFYPAIKNKGLTLYVDYDDTLSDYWVGSRIGIFRVLMNLVGNAVKFTEKGSITIKVKLGSKSTSDKTVVKFAVADTGIGIPQDKHKQIFDRFTRLTPSSNGIHSGSGLGLYLVQKLVDAMKGEIHLSSEEKKGSQFTIAIPLEIPLLTPSEYEENNLFSYGSQKLSPSIKPIIQEYSHLTPRNILVIEDNEIAQQVLKATFASLNCQTDIANCGKKAIELFQAGKYHYVFLDLGLPDMLGHVIATHLRKIEEGTTHQVPIIALTAHITPDIIKCCLEAGMNEILSKPLSMEQAKFIIHNIRA